ncbi:hypothetical protein ACFVXA_29540 [Streptomyces sp. NPDC058246]|uniref:hypothetical protein n=1 Tax=Streptomyces sp. NPDC058246 TaxID=3346400 RepID=UPI0036EA506C
MLGSGWIGGATYDDSQAYVLDVTSGATQHFRGGTSRATAFHWEINGTDGDLVAKADQAQWW